jgi:hypothetical protein
MEQKKPVSHFVAGVILAAIVCIYSTALNFMGMAQNKALGWLAYLLFAVVLIIFISMYGKARNNEVTFGNLFSYGFKATAFATLIIIVFLIAFFVALPEYKTKILEIAQKNMEDQGKMTDEQIQKAVGWFSNNFYLFMCGGALFMYLLCGAISSLIGAAITKKKPYNPVDQMSI